MRARCDDSPADYCEKLLMQMHNYNMTRKIMPAENEVIIRLRARHLEMQTAYEEIYNRLVNNPSAVEIFLDLVVRAAASWTPEKISEIREKRKELISINNQIADLARDFARLLKRRSELENESGFVSDTNGNVCRLIEEASHNNGHYQFYLKKELASLRGQYDWRYWPSLADLMNQIALEAIHAKVEPINSVVEAATESRISSKSDSLRAFLAMVEDNCEEQSGRLPDGFRLSDQSMADIMNCVLDLPPDEMVNSDYVKGFRQRQRRGLS